MVAFLRKKRYCGTTEKRFLLLCATKDHFVPKEF
jgi:hypothetical protein